MAERIEIYTDGSCLGNPGIGGWAYLIRGSDDRELTGSGRNISTTNNRMELQAVLEALIVLSREYIISLYSDSKYVVNGSEWVHGWRRNNWKLASGGGVKNQDQWEEYLRLSAPHKIRFHWIKGHDGHPENELVDRLAVEAAKNDALYS